MSKHGGRVNGRKDGCSKRGAPWSSSEVIEPDCFAEDGLGSRDAETDDDPWLYDLHFGFQPRATGSNLSSRWFLVFAPLALRFPFEVLYGIRDIHVSPGNACFKERLVQDFPRRTDKRMTREVFLIPGLLSDEHDRRMDGSFAKDCLSGASVQIASGAAGRCLP